MPRNSAGETEAQESDAYERPHWPEIGINAVAAASLCKSYNQRREEREAGHTSHLFDETDFATD